MAGKAANALAFNAEQNPQRPTDWLAWFDATYVECNSVRAANRLVAGDFQAYPDR